MMSTNDYIGIDGTRPSLVWWRHLEEDERAADVEGPVLIFGQTPFRGGDHIHGRVGRGVEDAREVSPSPLVDRATKVDEVAVGACVKGAAVGCQGELGPKQLEDPGGDGRPFHLSQGAPLLGVHVTQPRPPERLPRLTLERFEVTQKLQRQELAV